MRGAGHPAPWANSNGCRHKVLPAGLRAGRAWLKPRPGSFLFHVHLQGHERQPKHKGWGTFGTGCSHGKAGEVLRVTELLLTQQMGRRVLD